MYLFLSSREERDTHTLLGPLESANLTHSIQWLWLANGSHLYHSLNPVIVVS
jgi:hypothetical protein